MGKDSKIPKRITPDSVNSLSKASEEEVAKVKQAVSKPHVCKYPGCGKKFKSRAGLQSHFKTHIDDTMPDPTPEPVVSVKAVQGEAVNPTEEILSPSSPVILERDKSRKERIVARLAKQPQIDFIIPLAQGEKMSKPGSPGATVEVCINGVVLVYPKGEYFTAAKQVVELIRNSIEVQVTAGAEHKIEPGSEKEKALTK